MTDRESLLRLADNIASHGANITYPSRQAAQEVRNVVRELAAELRGNANPDAEQTGTSAQMLELMVDRSIGKCVSGHWLPLSGNCDLCGAGPADKCLFVLGATQGDHDDQTER